MTGAQKAIAAPPGISPISVSAKAKKYMQENPPATMYFNLARYFKYYDEDDFLVNTMVLSEIKEMGGRIIPTRMEIIPAENPDQKTVITYQNIDFEIDINENFFSIQNMKRVR